MPPLTADVARPIKSTAILSRMERLDLYLVHNGYAASRRQARELLAAGQVRVNGNRCRKGRMVGPSDVVEVNPSSDGPALKPNRDLALDVLYLDAEFLVVNKPGLLPCHPLHQWEEETLMNAVVARFPQTAEAGGKPLEGGLVHRLDNGTSGATMVALTAPGFKRLRAALRDNRIARTYLALVEGAIESALTLSAPIAHHPRNSRKMVVVNDRDRVARLKARPAITAVRPVRKTGRFTLVEVTPRTGNRHQIRVHLADAGYPLAGDRLYGGPAMAALAPGRFFLHLAALAISTAGPMDDPQHTGPVSVHSPLPADLEACLREAGA